MLRNPQRPRRQTSRPRRLRRLAILIAAGACLAAAAPSAVPARSDLAHGSVAHGLPQHPDPRNHYLIFLHGRVVEEHGIRPVDPRFGVYEYQAILDSLAARGFSVIGEVRPQGTEIGAWADRVVGQVRSLLAAGVPPRHVAVLGFSKGASIALVAAARLAHPEVPFVSLAGCGDWLVAQFHPRFAGPVLSLYDEADDLVTPCAPLFAAGPHADQRREIELHAGKGHGTFYRPDPIWLDPVSAWLMAPASPAR